MRRLGMILLGVAALALSPVTASADYGSTMHADGPEYAPQALVLDVSLDTLVSDLAIAFAEHGGDVALTQPIRVSHQPTLCDMAREGSTPTVARDEHLEPLLAQLRHDTHVAAGASFDGGVASFATLCRRD